MLLVFVLFIGLFVVIWNIKYNKLKSRAKYNPSTKTTTFSNGKTLVTSVLGQVFFADTGEIVSPCSIMAIVANDLRTDYINQQVKIERISIAKNMLAVSSASTEVAEKDLNELSLCLQEIKKLSQNKTLPQRGLKLMEEAGELAVAILGVDKAPGQEYKGLDLNNVKEEVIDVLLVSLSICYSSGMTDDEILTGIKNKLDKWKKIQG
jgi:NTP pyrophosphatase (non-canonical NTP hydrolase)